MRGELSETLWEAMSALLFVEGGRELGATDGQGTDSKAFDGFEITHEITYENVIETTGLSELPVWPIDVSLATAPGAAGIRGDAAEHWVFNRWVSLNPRNWRGQLSRHLPRMVEHHYAQIAPDGWCAQGCVPLGIAGGKFVTALARARDYVHARPSWMPDVTATIETFLPGIILRREYLWSVLLAEGAGPRARFTTDASGVREAFRLRDIPAGKSRRAALRHWVTGHWRTRKRESAADRAWVREHLRGATEFAWNGLRCRIEPSREDLRRNLENPA